MLVGCVLGKAGNRSYQPTVQFTSLLIEYGWGAVEEREGTYAGARVVFKKVDLQILH